MFVGNLNQSTTEKDLNEPFGFECTPYLQETYCIEMPKNKHTGQSKGFALLNLHMFVMKQLNLMALNTKIKPLIFKKRALNIYLNLIKLQLDQAQLLIIILKTKMCLFEIFKAINAMLKLRFHQTAQGLPTMLFLGIELLNLVLD